MPPFTVGSRETRGGLLSPRAAAGAPPSQASASKSQREAEARGSTTLSLVLSLPRCTELSGVALGVAPREAPRKMSELREGTRER